MTNLIVNRGLQLALDRAFNLGGNAVRGIVVDDSTTAISATTTSFSGTNIEANDFNATPSRVAQTVTAEATFSPTEANFTHRRIALTDQAPTTSGSVTIYGGIDSLSSSGIVKSSDFSVKHIIRHTATNDSTGTTIWVNQGLQVVLDALYGLGSARILSMGFDDNSGTHVAGDTTFQGSAAAISKTFDSAVRNAQTVTCTATIPKGSAGTEMNSHVIKRMNLNTQASNVAETASSISGLCAAIYSQTMQKELDYSITQEIDVTATSS